MTSPGGLYNGLTYEEVMNGHSKIRNKGIANIFSQMGLGEASEKHRRNRGKQISMIHNKRL